ncbi:MAG TPA: hypothetical protein VF701_12795 [Thermoanaerobaculia bacterium]
MKTLAIALTLAAFALSLSGDEDAVRAAKEQKAKRKNSTSRVITNADLPKAKGKVVDSGREMTPVPPPPAESSLERHEAARRAELVAVGQIAAANRLVQSIETELASIEKSYFDESDLDRRDSEIVRRFEEAGERLRRAREALEVLRQKPEPNSEVPPETR